MGNPFIIAEDLALKTYLGNLIVSDQKNPSRPVKVWFGYPDVEIRDQSFPFLTIDLIDITPANERQTSGRLIDNDYRGTITPVNNGVYSYDIPIAYDLSYQITSYARNPRHDRALMYQLFNKFPSKFGYLRVPNKLETEFSARSMFLDGFVKRDAVDDETGNRRLLRNVFSVRIVSEMTPQTALTAGNTVRTVKINKTTTHIPSRYNPV
jgi:hypothetical protein